VGDVWWVMFWWVMFWWVMLVVMTNNGEQQKKNVLTPLVKLVWVTLTCG
jgi:hypothetical protein